MTQEADALPVLPSKCTLHQGDCLDVMPELKPKSVDIVFADLPYKSKTFHSTDCAWDLALPLDVFWQRVDAVSSANGVTVMTSAQPFTTDLIASNRKAFKYALVWDKPGGGNMMRAKYAPIRSHEDVVVFCNGQNTYNPQMVLRDKPRVFKEKDRNKSQSGGPWRPNGQFVKVYTHRFPRSIITASNKSSKDRGLHPTQKPIALLEWLIQTYTNPGDTVLDPVFGSATTAVACARLGRNFIGIEKDAGYFRIGRERVDAERTRLGLQPCEV